MVQKSEWNGLDLPSKWDTLPSARRIEVIRYLQGRVDHSPYWWKHTFTSTERQRVVLHLCACGSLTEVNTPVRECAGPYVHHAIEKARRRQAVARTQIEDYRVRHPEVIAAFEESAPIRRPSWSFDFNQAESRVHRTLANKPDVHVHMLYPKPNGGNRILPSGYTKLTTYWLRGNGVYQRPDCMNQGHLENTVNLLNESHVNLIDKMSGLLGRMHAHLHNRPDLQEDIEDLFYKLESVTVDELYPIVRLLADQIKPKEPEIEINPDSDWLDNANYPF